MDCPVLYVQVRSAFFLISPFIVLMVVIQVSRGVVVSGFVPPTIMWALVAAGYGCLRSRRRRKADSGTWW